ncbi:MAG: response regulator [Chloroflexi bacterium SZAS-1]|jgi:CheY-like chemotaxis protein|nr:response regulator [Chloroflexi bacterium SZAS-1]HNP84934.1 response regulator [Kouleothrix sp.]
MVTQPLRILLVEDDGSIARVIAIAMRDLGVPYHLDQAYSAEEGLELWAQEPYDLVLSDYNLRGMNGIAMIAEIKTQAPDLPTVLFTAYDERPVRQAARQVGVTHFIAKPFMIDDMIDVARALLPLHSSELGS